MRLITGLLIEKKELVQLITLIVSVRMKVELNLNNESLANLVMISYCYRRSNETCSGELPWGFDIINPIGIKTCTYMKLTFHLFSPDAE